MNSEHEQDIKQLVNSYTGYGRRNSEKMIAHRQETVNRILAKDHDLDAEALSREVAQRVEQSQRNWQRTFSILVACFIVVVLCLAMTALFASPPVKAPVRAIALTWLNVPASVITPTVTLTPTSTSIVTSPTEQPTLTFTPTPLPVYQIGARIVQYGSGEGLANASVTFNVRSQGGGTWQTQETMDLSPDGSFSFTYAGAEPPEVQLLVTLPELWQLWDVENIAFWKYEKETNSFTLALVDKNEATLELTAAAVRQFEGQVALSTASDGANASGIVSATVDLQTCTQAGDPATCSETVATVETGEDGHFKLEYPSPYVEAQAYRLVPVPPAGYATQLITTTIPSTGDFVWDKNASGLLSTQALVPGEFVELNMVLQLQSITILATDDQLTLHPDETTWQASDYPNPEAANDSIPGYYVYTTIVPADDPPTVGATWELYLSAGEYYVEVWTPEGMSTPVRYTVELETDSTGSFSPIDGVVSLQKNRRGLWFDFQSKQEPLIINSMGEWVVVRVMPTQEYADTTMAIGPIRFIVGVPTAPPATPTPPPSPEPSPEASPSPESG